MAYRSACSTGRDSKSARAWLLEVGAAMLVSAVLVAMVLPAFGAGRAGGAGGVGSARHVASIVAMNAIAMGVDDYSVNVTIAGTGTGMIQDLPNGFSCGSGTCTFMYLFGAFEDANLTATAGAGSHFVMWSTGDCAGSTNPFCMFQTGPTNPTQTAVFELNPACCDPTTGACVVEFPCTAPRVLASPASTTCTPNPCLALLGACCASADSAACSLTLAQGCTGSSVFNGVGSTCAPNNPCAGACCANVGGACTVAGSQFCVTGGGAFQGVGTTCTPDPCPAQLGACCASSDSSACSLTNAQGCTGSSVFNGVGSTCSPNNPCAGACCASVGGACTIDGSLFCVTGGGVFRGVGTTCTPNPCLALGACCASSVSSACSLTFAQGCTGSSVFNGVGSTCSPNNPCAGACCANVGGACTIDGSMLCVLGGGAFQGLGTTCTPDPCPAQLGACCASSVSSACSVGLAQGCTGSSIFKGVGSTCSPVNPCGGACCDNVSGACTITGTLFCASLAGTFQGLGTTCTPNPCAANACCNATNGVCSVVFPGAACPPGFILASPATFVCDPSPCPQPTACCDTTSGACTIALPSSVCPAGTVAAMASSCTPGLCPQPTACCNTTSGACTVALPSIACVAGTVAASTSCTAGLCPQPTACCDTTSGACTIALPSSVCPAGTLAAMSSSCTPGPCPQPFACCNATSGACSTVPPLGDCAPGTIATMATSCTAGLCPQPTACCDPITGACSVAAPSVACAAGTFAAPGGASACLPSPCPFPGSPALLGCTDCWYNGPIDIIRGDGQISHLGGAAPNGAKAADDFTLAGDFVHDVKTITATLLTTTTPGLVKPKAEIWSDCNGCPSELLYTLDNALVVETGLTEGLAFDGRPLRVVHVTFDVTTQTVLGNRNIVLKGGNYWLSVYGRSDGLGPTMQMYDITYWGTTRGFGGGVQGKPAYKIDGLPTPNYNVFNFPAGCGPLAWHSVVDDCCIGCTDLNFTFCSTGCKVIVDNGGARRQVAAEPVGSTSQFAPASLSAAETRSADDFVLPGCQDYHICYVEACILTNCPTFDGVFEVYANDCDRPSYALHGAPLAGQFVATKIIPLGFTALMDGRTVTAYKLEFHDLTLVLTGGRQYWLSAGVRYTFSINERAYFCYNADCARTCLIRWNEGRVLTATTLDDYARAHGCTSPVICNGWAKVGSDFSFLIAGDGLTTPGPINSTPWCPVDYNRDGALNTTDIFDYLNAWFAGCH